jgi:hypothetical protein
VWLSFAEAEREAAEATADGTAGATADDIPDGTTNASAAASVSRDDVTDNGSANLPAGVTADDVTDSGTANGAPGVTSVSAGVAASVAVYSEAAALFRSTGQKEERLIVLEAWRDAMAAGGATEGELSEVEAMMPKRLKKRRQVYAEDGEAAGCAPSQTSRPTGVVLSPHPHAITRATSSYHPRTIRGRSTARTGRRQGS